MPAENPNFAIKGLMSFSEKTRRIGWGGVLVGIFLPPVLIPAIGLSLINLAIDNSTNKYRIPRSAS